MQRPSCAEGPGVLCRGRNPDAWNHVRQAGLDVWTRCSGKSVPVRSIREPAEAKGVPEPAKPWAVIHRNWLADPVNSGVGCRCERRPVAVGRATGANAGLTPGVCGTMP